MEVVAASAGVAAGFGACAGGHVGDSEAGDGVAQRGWLAGGDDDADLREEDAENGDEADEGLVWQVELRVRLIFVVSSVGAHAWEGDGELGFPTVFVEIFQVSAEGECLEFPVGESEECTDSDAAETTGVGAFRAVQPPVEVLFRSGGVELGISLAVVSFLIDDESLRAVVNDFRILLVFHGADFESEGGDERLEGVEAFLEVSLGDKFWVLAGDEEEIAESKAVEVARLGDDLIDGECGAENGGVA